MSVIIRLQNLPWSANSLDIRHYFSGLSIPEGGVHIVGGEMGDAFIAFSTDEDARQAMMLGGGKIKEVQIMLRLSSRSEMQKVIEAARQASMSNSLAQLLAPTVPTAPPVPLISLAQQGALSRRDSREDKKDSSDLSSSSHDGIRRDRKDKSRSRSRDRDRGRRDRRDKDRDRDRDRDRRRRSRTRSRSRDRRRRRSRSRSRGRDRKDSKEEIKKQEPIAVNNPVMATTLPNLNLLNTTAWATAVTAVPPVLAQATPIFDKLANLGLLRNLASQASGIPAAQLSLSNTPQMIPENSLSPRKDNNFQSRNDFSIGTRRGDSKEHNRGNFQRDNDSDNRNDDRNFRNFDDNSQGSFQRFGNDDRFNQNRPNFNRQNNNKPGFQRNNEQGNNRFGNFDNFSNQAGNRGIRGLMDFPNQRDGRFNNRFNSRFREGNEPMDEFGRNVQLRSRRNTTEESSVEEEENFQGRQAPNLPFQSRFLPQNQQQTPPPLLPPGRESWPPGRNQRNENFQDRRNFRNDNFFDNRFRGKNDFKLDNRQNNGDNGPKLSQEDDCYVEVRGLPPNTVYGDVRRPFSALKIIIQDIKFFDNTDVDKKCRIKFLNFENKMKALQNNNKILFEGKPLPLLHISHNHFDECNDEGVRRPEAKFSDDEEDVAPEETCLQIKDVPFSATEADIESLFQGCLLEKISLEPMPDRKNKTAYVKFSKAVDARVALNNQNRQIGDLKIVLLPLSLDRFKEKFGHTESNKLEMENGVNDFTNENSQSSMDEAKNHNSPISGSDCVLIKNLPFEANDRDICDFFSDIGLVPTRIHLMLDVNSQPSGDAFCEFSHPEQALKACTKNGAPMGKNILSLEQIPRIEMLEALGVDAPESKPAESLLQMKPPELMQPRQFPLPGPGPNNGFGRPQCVVALENVPFRASSFDIIKFFGWPYKLTEDDIMRRYNERGQPTGDARVCFKSAEDALKAVRFMNNKQLNGRPVRMKIL